MSELKLFSAVALKSTSCLVLLYLKSCQSIGEEYQVGVECVLPISKAMLYSRYYLEKINSFVYACFVKLVLVFFGSAYDR